MDTVTKDRQMTMADMPLGPDGLMDFLALAVGLVEQCVNAAMDAAADEPLGEGNRRNGYLGPHLLGKRQRVGTRLPACANVDCEKGPADPTHQIRRTIKLVGGRPPTNRTPIAGFGDRHSAIGPAACVGLTSLEQR